MTVPPRHELYPPPDPGPPDVIESLEDALREAMAFDRAAFSDAQVAVHDAANDVLAELRRAGVHRLPVAPARGLPRALAVDLLADDVRDKARTLQVSPWRFLRGMPWRARLRVAWLFVLLRAKDAIGSPTGGAVFWVATQIGIVVAGVYVAARIGVLP